MKKILIILSIFLFLNNCGGFEFVYKTNQNDFLIKNITNISVDGDNATEIYILLRDTIGNNADNFPKYKLLVNSSKNESALVIRSDATASTFKIQYLINYNLYNLHKNCAVISKEITTINTYNVKSAGYSFGTDLSENESNRQNIVKNIHEFLFSLNSLPSLNKCEK